MTELLHKFLKDKGEEFCYGKGNPQLVNPNIRFEYLEEYAEHVKSISLTLNATKCTVFPHIHREARYNKGVCEKCGNII